MSDSRAIDVANAAVLLLNSGPAQSGFNQTFTAVRAYRPVYDLTEHKAGLKVTVVPKTLDTSPFARRTVQEMVGVDVAVQDFVNAATEVADCDVLMELVEQIKEVMEAAGALALTDPPFDCGWQGTVNEPIYDPDHLQKFSVFTSVPTFTYLTRRPR